MAGSITTLVGFIRPGVLAAVVAAGGCLMFAGMAAASAVGLDEWRPAAVGTIRDGFARALSGETPLPTLPATGEDPGWMVGLVRNPNGLMLDDRQYKGRAYSSGVMVGPCHFLTAYHGVFGDAPPDPDLTFDVHLGPRGGTDFAHVERAHAVAVRPYWRTGELADDLALLHLPSCVGTQTGWMAPWRGSFEEARQAPDLGQAFYWGTRIFSGDRRIFLMRGCRPVSADAAGTLWRSDCVGVPGASGSPLFQIDGEGRPRLLAISQGAGLDKPFFARWLSLPRSAVLIPVGDLMDGLVWLDPPQRETAAAAPAPTGSRRRPGR